MVRHWRRPLLLSRGTSSCLVSCVFHALVLIILGLIVQTVEVGSPGGGLIVYTTGRLPIEDLADELEWEVRPAGLDWRDGDAGLTDEAVVLPAAKLPLIGSFASDGPPVSAAGLETSRPVPSLPSAHVLAGGGLEGRGPEARPRLVRKGGGTGHSEEAVERGLRWLAAYQREDGSWSFDHSQGRQSGFSRNPGTVASTTGATAMALMPFLGAGYTHFSGEHRETVRRGLYYLLRRALMTPEGADLQEGTMYAQGLAAIVLCEAYAMTGDPQLKDVAQRAVDFIDYAQDKKGGGWRYTPGEPGDTTVTGWELMALKSAQLANLRVRSPTVLLVSDFLDSVQSEGGAKYGYMTPEARKTTTAIGLLCRMYTGWPRRHTGLRQGVAYLSRWGPSEQDIYYDYYATQVMRHWGGYLWEDWNGKMRDYLIATQSMQGHEAGSWYFPGDPYGQSGGRLYHTAMAVMTLEVYYRYMPIYGERAFDD